MRSLAIRTEASDFRFTESRATHDETGSSFRTSMVVQEAPARSKAPARRWRINRWKSFTCEKCRLPRETFLPESRVLNAGSGAKGKPKSL